MGIYASEKFLFILDYLLIRTFILGGLIRVLGSLDINLIYMLFMHTPTQRKVLTLVVTDILTTK